MENNSISLVSWRKAVMEAQRSHQRKILPELRRIIKRTKFERVKHPQALFDRYLEKEIGIEPSRWRNAIVGRILLTDVEWEALAIQCGMPLLRDDVLKNCIEDALFILYKHGEASLSVIHHPKWLRNILRQHGEVLPVNAGELYKSEELI